MLLKCGIHKVKCFCYQSLLGIEFNVSPVSMFARHYMAMLLGAFCVPSPPVVESCSFPEEFLVIRGSLIKPCVGSVPGFCLLFIDKLWLISFQRVGLLGLSGGAFSVWPMISQSLDFETCAHCFANMKHLPLFATTYLQI